MYPAPPAIRIFIYCLLVPFLDTTKVPVSITYAYGTILAVREEQSPALKRDTSLRHGACYNLFLSRSRLLSWADATFQPPLGDVKSCSESKTTGSNHTRALRHSTSELFLLSTGSVSIALV